MTFDQIARIIIMALAFPLIKIGADYLKKQPWAEFDDKYINPFYWLKHLKEKRRDIV